MSHTIRVRIYNRDFSLVVKEEDEELTRSMATYVDGKMREFLRSHPDQSEYTAAVIAAMAIAEELFTEREERNRLENRLDQELADLSDKLGEVLVHNGS